MNTEELIKKWLSDDLTASELQDFEKLDDADLNKDIIEGAGRFKASHFSKMDSYDLFKQRLEEKETPVIPLRSFKKLYRIAAILVIGISIYFGFFFNNLTTVQTLASNKTTFELPDASSVTLNAASKVNFSKRKWSDKREVSLDGEAFFIVAKGSKFDVVTTGGTVSVLGTQFNVKNREDYFEVKCFEGIVSVTSNGKMQKLTKGDTYRVINGVIAIDATLKNRPGWMDNISSFKSVPLEEVLEELERQYNIDVTVQEFDDKRLFTGGFVHDNLEEALNEITVPFNLSYKKDSSNKIILYKME